MGERYNIHSQLEHLQSKYIGTGHADTTKYDWAVNQHRDSLASYQAWLPDGDSQILRLYAFGPLGFWTMAPLHCKI